MTTLTSREFNQEVGRAKTCAEAGPVFITDHGRQTHVLLSMEEYRKLTGSEMTLTQMLWSPEAAGAEDLELPERRVEEVKGAELD